MNQVYLRSSAAAFWLVLGILLSLLNSSVQGDQLACINDPDGFTNLRSAPTIDSKVIRRVTVTESFLITDTVGNWRKVEFVDGAKGFLHSSRVRIMTGESIIKETDDIVGELKHGDAKATEMFLIRMGELSERIKLVPPETKAIVLMQLADAEAPLLDGEGYEIYLDLADEKTIECFKTLLEKRKTATAATYKPGPAARFFLQWGKNIVDGFKTGNSTSNGSTPDPICIACNGRGRIVCGPHSSNVICLDCNGSGWVPCRHCDGRGRGR